VKACSEESPVERIGFVEGRKEGRITRVKAKVKDAGGDPVVFCFRVPWFWRLGGLVGWLGDVREGSPEWWAVPPVSSSKK